MRVFQRLNCILGLARYVVTDRSSSSGGSFFVACDELLYRFRGNQDAARDKAVADRLAQVSKSSTLAQVLDRLILECQALFVRQQGQAGVAGRIGQQGRDPPQVTRVPRARLWLVSDCPVEQPRGTRARLAVMAGRPPFVKAILPIARFVELGRGPGAP